MIKNFIIKTNVWYENLPNIKGDIFYLSLIFIPYIILMITLSDRWHLLSLAWPFSVALWRFSFKVIKDIKGLK